MGLPHDCQNLALKAEANLDSVLELAQKCALSHYARLNPSETTQKVLAKTLFNQKLPVWTLLLTGAQHRDIARSSWRGNKNFPGIPTQIWESPIQTKLAKKELLAIDTTQTNTKTLETGITAAIEECKYKHILYTDASVDILSTPPRFSSNRVHLVPATY